MAGYIGKRTLMAVITIFIISLLTFLLMHSVPGGPFDSGKALSPGVQEELEERFHLNDPLITQYITYMSGLFHGDFGISLKTGREISDIIKESFPISAKIGFIAVLVALLAGTFLGCIAALFRNRWPDKLIIFLSTLLTSIPSFVLATLLLLVFCIKLAIIPVWSAEETNIVLPVIALAAYPMAYTTRLVKTSMLDAFTQDYIRTAKAKGAPWYKVIFKHALRNGVIPVVTYAGPEIAYIITGSMVVESIFSLGGIGGQFVSAITNRDYTMIMATTIFLAVIMVVANLLVDIAYKLIDPRIKLN